MLGCFGAWSADGHPPTAQVVSAVVTHVSTPAGSRSPNPSLQASTNAPSTDLVACQRTPSSAVESEHFLSFILALLHHLVQLLQLRRPKGRRIGPELGNRPLLCHSEGPRHRLIHGFRALCRPLHSSEYKLVTQISKVVSPRPIPRIQCTAGFGQSNHVQAGTHEHIERGPVVATVRAQC
ncbi:hypothetical protein TRVL_08459 [Trypanosoma vivax]|nr:hypothetical protein TRVL_08459 [Trypanosoma vivax]